MKLLSKIYLPFFLLSLGWGACSDELPVTETHQEEENVITAGEELSFSLQMPASSKTRAQDWTLEELENYKPIGYDPHLAVDDQDIIANYSPIKISMINNDGTVNVSSNYQPKLNDDGTFDVDGNLEVVADSAPLYWPDNVNQWGFEASAGNEVISVGEDGRSDQTTKDKWFANDYIHGYGFLPVWEEGDGADKAQYSLSAINYRTSKQWYADHKKLYTDDQIPDTEECKKIPLYMRHQHAWITVILKAGNGVPRSALAYRTQEEYLHTTIHSFKEDGTPVDITPWCREYLVDYVADQNGPADQNVSSVKYDAIVYPHDYTQDVNGSPQIMLTVDLSGNKFIYAARNDKNYANNSAIYNLAAGKHLIIEATLTSDKIIHIIAWIVDWEDSINTTICDDYGQNGDPEQITNRVELEDFLKDANKNAPGNLAIIATNTIDLGDDWSSTYELKANLNLSKSVIKTKTRLFSSLASSASLLNGTIELQDGAQVDAVVATTNYGTIEQVKLTKATGATANATKAGFVEINYGGHILKCSSEIPVVGTIGVTDPNTSTSDPNKYVGGIAALSLKYQVGEGMFNTPIIDGCYVDARVDGGTGIYGGGIVGKVAGSVTSNTFEYGITVDQVSDRFKNIFAVADNETIAKNNAWPTNTINPVIEEPQTDNENTYSVFYNGVIDSATGLEKVLTSGNSSSYNYRLATDFSVTSDWNYGVKSRDVERTTYNNADSDLAALLNKPTGNVFFTLEGNNKTITLTGTSKAPMLFSNIIGRISNLVIFVDKPIKSEPEIDINGDKDATDAIAPLAYNLYGGTLSNVYVHAKKDDENPSVNAYVESSTPAGLVVWASNGATIENCHVGIDVKMNLPEGTSNQSSHYAGGIVANVSKATITDSQYQGSIAISGHFAAPDNMVSAPWYHGGIVGGLKHYDSNDEVLLKITNCGSWFGTVDSNENTTHGSMIGLAAYSENNTLKDGMSPENTGNWWIGKGAGKTVDGKTVEQAIGKKNQAVPSFKALPDD